ncbi:telomere repeats-binding bouquet formation protein 1-like [Ornithorhynchus anatinus]|uniref:Telomere repeat binding bouquet formation protein 1 n=1 Tax=Ornithorhynchus anatinus TaxID=9258 RepID=K7EEW3_ORNAN|nr:telomere repeats-binding bouquet formation protein 1-like [Ornithorhynchus anatinus]
MGLTCADINVGLLLDCIKQQLNNIPAVTNALLLITSICQEHSNTCVYFQDIGGLKLVHKLARSDVPSSLKEVALYMLGSLANSHVLCQQSLCTTELFDEMLTFMVDENSSTNLQSVSVSVLLSLVSKNGDGQRLLRETDCLSVLQKLFRETLTKSEIDSSNESFMEKYPLWNALCSTLGAAVNNPQNEENQKICCSILPHVQTLLEVSKKPEIVCPLCLLIGLTVAENPSVQKFFMSIGGLDILADVFIKLAGDACQNISSAKVAVTVTITMGVCIADNPPGSRILAKHQVVPKLLTLLLLDSLDPGEKNSVLFTLGHTIVSCAEELFVQHLANASQEIPETEERGKALGSLKRNKNILPKKKCVREEDEEQGPKTDGVVEDALLKDSDQEEALPNQCSESGAQICHMPAKDELKSQLESPGEDAASVFCGKHEPTGSERVFDHPAPEDETRVQQPPKEEQPENP